MNNTNSPSVIWDTILLQVLASTTFDNNTCQHRYFSIFIESQLANMTDVTVSPDNVNTVKKHRKLLSGFQLFSVILIGSSCNVCSAFQIDITNLRTGKSFINYNHYCNDFGVHDHHHAILTSSFTSSSSLSMNNNNQNDVLYKEEWSVTDDWNQMSSENPQNMADDSRRLMDQDIVRAVANILAEESNGKTSLSSSSSPEEVWMEDTIAHIYENQDEEKLMTLNNNAIINDSNDEVGDQDDFEEKMSQEIALLVRCNQQPEQMLINEGRAVPELSTQQLYDVSQLVEAVTNEETDISIMKKTRKWKPTTFLTHAVHNMFKQHASIHPDNERNVNDNEVVVNKVLDARGIASWMQVALKQPLDITSNMKQIGPHDPTVKDIIARYGSYGNKFLSENEFVELYVSTILGDHDLHHDNDDSTLSFEKLQKYQNVNIMNVWREIRNHNIISPNELQRMIDISDINTRIGLDPDNKISLSSKENVLDECELIYENDDLGVGKGISYTSDKQGRSSHESVITIPNNSKINDSSAATGTSSSAITRNTPIPLYMKDTDFVFIDEETCIGCMQCVSIAPASFTMIGDGRARAFFQRPSKDVNAAVTACPVDCMHMVSYDELVELEVARDVGVSDDHRHFGHTQARGYIPRVPLHVSRRDSDANHRSSFYHFVKDQCFKSSQCPQRGCYDCPRYKANPDENPYFQERMKLAQHEKAQYLIESGMADPVRKVAEI